MRFVGVTATMSQQPYRLQPPLTIAYFTQSVMHAGGIPALLPALNLDLSGDWHHRLKLDLRNPPIGDPDVPVSCLATVDAVLANLHGVLITGGEDMEPGTYGAALSALIGKINRERDASELLIAYRAIQRRLPILAICRGLQLVNVLLGGTLEPHLEPGESGIQHERAYNTKDVPPDYWAPWHEIRFCGDSKLSSCFPGKTAVGVSSYHHQAAKLLAPGLRCTAIAEDGVIEAFEDDGNYPFLMAIQGHPEVMWPHGYEEWLAPFKLFIAACSR